MEGVEPAEGEGRAARGGRGWGATRRELGARLSDAASRGQTQRGNPRGVESARRGWGGGGGGWRRRWWRRRPLAARVAAGRLGRQESHGGKVGGRGGGGGGGEMISVMAALAPWRGAAAARDTARERW